MQAVKDAIVQLNQSDEIGEEFMEHLKSVNPEATAKMSPKGSREEIGTQRQAKYDLLHEIATGKCGTKEDHLLTHLSNFIAENRQQQ